MPATPIGSRTRTSRRRTKIRSCGNRPPPRADQKKKKKERTKVRNNAGVVDERNGGGVAAKRDSHRRWRWWRRRLGSRAVGRGDRGQQKQRNGAARSPLSSLSRVCRGEGRRWVCAAATHAAWEWGRVSLSHRQWIHRGSFEFLFDFKLTEVRWRP